MTNVPLMKENEFSVLGKFSTIILVLIFTGTAIINISRHTVPKPYAFIVVLFGFLFFIAAKVSNIKKHKLISFGTSNMSENMSNLYRLGYWLMVIGLLLTFA